MLYRLLRNNIESGPFSKEEIIKQGLLPSDQIKLEGDTEWHAPNTLNEFKELVAHFPKPKFKITANKEVIEIKEENTKSTPAEKNTSAAPFKRVPSALPKKRDSKPEEQKQETPTQMRSAIQASIQNIESAPRLEKKERKLQPIKKEARASSSNFKKEVIIPIFILAAAGLISWFAYKKLTTPALAIKPPAHVVTDSSVKTIAKNDSTAIPHPPKAPTKSAVQNMDSTKLFVSKDSSHKKSDTTNTTEPTVASSAIDKDSIAKTKASASANEEKPAKQMVAQENTTEEKEKPTKQQTRTSSKKANNHIQSISDYISLSLNKIPSQEVRNIKMRIKNISNQQLNIAVIDVKYLDVNGNTISGETLQATNIEPGKTVTVKVPNNKNAVNISYHVSLISGENIYLMGN